MSKHKWHKEIKHWADGGEIEFARNDYPDIWDIDDNPDFNATHGIFRIKPQQQQSSCCPCKQTCSALKEPQYLYVYATSKGYQFALKHGAVEVGSLNEIANCIGKIKLEVDDE